MNTAIYARVSTDDQKCEQQLTELRTYVIARGWTLQGEYVDQGLSGKRDTRPALNRLLDAARRRAVDAIVVWKLDRWGRSMGHIVSSIQELDSLGVRFVAVTQGIDTDHGNATSRLMLNLLGAFADFEQSLISERTRAGLARARREGRIGGRPRVVVDRQRIQQLDADGFTTREIAEEVGCSAASVCRILKRA